MIGLFLFVGLLSAGSGPELDSLEGSVLDADTRDALPSGRHMGSYGDLFFVELVNLQNAGGGGIARFDNLMQSSHGFSWMQLQWRLNGLDITDPMMPGSPIVSLPSRLWDSLRYRHAWVDQPTFDIEVDRPSYGQQAGSAELRVGSEIGGSTWLPAGFMDREPATTLGVNPSRRALARATELFVTHASDGTLVAAEVAQHVHRYPTLVSSGYDEEIAQEAMGFAMAPIAGLGDSTEWFLGWNVAQRSHDQAQFRYPSLYTHELESTGVVSAITGSEAVSKTAQVDWAWGAMYRGERRRGWEQGAPSVDIDGQWTWLARPKAPDQEQRVKLGGTVEFSERADTWFQGVPGDLTLNGSAYRSWMVTQSGLSGQALTTTWLAGRGGPSDSGAQTVTVYEDSESRIVETLDDVRARVRWGYKEGDFVLQIHAGWDFMMAGGGGIDTLWLSDPGLGVAVEWTDGDYVFFGAIRREPELLTSNVGAFLNSERPSSMVQQWLDDGDGDFESGEAGEIVRSTGGAFHVRDPNLHRATSNQLSFGLRIQKVGPFDFVWKNDARLHLHRYTVRYSPEGAPGYERTMVDDPFASEPIEAWARVSGTPGEERYMLTNSSDPNLFMGTGFTWVTRPGLSWFMNLSAVAYFSVGTAPFGLFPDVNDPSVLSESTADPNGRVAAKGRFDHCRAFGVNLLAGFHPTVDTSAGVLLRYRDGEPITRFVTAELPQGPTSLMAVPRGAPIPRHTFHMTLDLKLSYEPKLWALDTSLVVEVYNVLGSGTELLEDFTTTDEYRRSLEMVPGRSGMVSLGLRW